MSKSTRMSVANSKVQKAKLSMAAQMVLNDELTLQIEKLQPAVDKSELLDEEPKESPLVSQNENDACDEDMPEENLKEKVRR